MLLQHSYFCSGRSKNGFTFCISAVTKKTVFSRPTSTFMTESMESSVITSVPSQVWNLVGQIHSHFFLIAKDKF